MDQHGLDAERIRNEAGVLPAGAAERVEHVFRDVISALHRDGLDSVRHVLDGDLYEAVGDLFRSPPVSELPRQCFERLAHRRRMERLILTRTENARKELG